MNNNIAGGVFVFIGILLILFFSFKKIESEISFAYKVKGIGAGIISIITGMSFILRLIQGINSKVSHRENANASNTKGIIREVYLIIIAILLP